VTCVVGSPIIRHVADQEDDRVAQVLEVFHLAQQNRVAQMQVRRGGVEAGFDPEFAAVLAARSGARASLFADDLAMPFRK